MAAIHVLERVGGSEYRVAVHWATPAGTNSAGVAWKTALLNSGEGGVTILPDGDGTGGTISSTEKASIVAGDVMETIGMIRVDTVAGGATGVNAFLDAEAARITSEAQNTLAALLRFFGGTRG